MIIQNNAMVRVISRIIDNVKQEEAINFHLGEISKMDKRNYDHSSFPYSPNVSNPFSLRSASIRA